MADRTRTWVALAGSILLGSSSFVLAGPGTRASADDRPFTWSGSAEASGVRVSLVKPAMLPTADEVAGLSVPFARTETDSSPSGRAVGSWLWPGEGVADAKSLLLVGLDPSTSQAEVEARKKRHPGTDGCAPERALEAPAVPDPRGGGDVVEARTIVSPFTGQPVMDPRDNPCGEYSARTALQTLVRERVPDYPFWAHSSWPPNRQRDAEDARSLCGSPGAFPSSWDLPSDACPGVEPPRGGWVHARSTDDGDWSTAQLAALEVPGIARAAKVTSLARTEWQGSALVSTAGVTMHDLTIFGAGGAEFIRIASLTSSAVSGSDGRPPRTTLEASGVSVTIAGRALAARIERGHIVVADESLPADVQRRLDEALRLLATSIWFGDDADGAGASAAAARSASEGGVARVAALTIDLGARASVEGASTLRLSFGVAEASAATRRSAVFVPPPYQPPVFAPTDDANGSGRPGLQGSSPSGPSLGEGFGSAPARPRPLAAPVLPESRPIPVAVALATLLAALAGAAALVAAGIWETMFP